MSNRPTMLLGGPGGPVHLPGGVEGMMVAKRIYLVTGSRYWGRSLEHHSKAGAASQKAVIHKLAKQDELARARMCKVVSQMVPGSILLQGGAPGADQLAEEEAFEHALFPLTMPYAKFLGRGGGPARNRKMQTIMVGLRTAGWATTVVSFHEDLARSKGTVDMVRIALNEDFPVKHVSLISAHSLRTSKDLSKLLKG